MNLITRIRGALGRIRERVSSAVAKAIAPVIYRSQLAARREALGKALPAGNAPYKGPVVRSFLEWDPHSIRAAELSADGGYLVQAARLCEAMSADDRVRGCLTEVRVKGLLGLPLSFEPGKGRRKQSVVKALEAEEDFYAAFPTDELAQLHAWGILLGVSFAQILWEEQERPGGSKRVIPTIHFIHPMWTRFEHSTGKWFARLDSGGEIDITIGDGRFLAYTPFGSQRPWARGAWRSLSRFWLLKLYALADWGRYSERNGMGVFVGEAPAGANPKDRADLAAYMEGIGTDAAIALPPGYSIKLVEATAKTWDTFQAQMACADTASAINLLGQNLTTDVSGGSYAAAIVHKAVQLQIIRSDADSLATALHDQILVFWAEYNFGDRGLAPWPCWDTTPPEDLVARAETQAKAAQASKDWAALGVAVDMQSTARAYGVLIDEDATEPVDISKGEIFKYHLDYGVFTTNEIRASRGLPPVPGGDVPPKPIAGAPTDEPSGQLKLSNHGGFVTLASGDTVPDTSGLIQGQQYIDGLTAHARDAACRALNPTIDKLVQIIEQLDDTPDWPEKLKERLLEQVDEFGPDDFDAVVEKAFVMAELAGLHAAQEQD